MSTDRDLTGIVRSWLDDGVTRLPDRVLDAVLDQVPATRQRRAWWPAWRFREMTISMKLILAVAAVIVVAVVGANILPRQGGVGGPAPTSLQELEGAWEACTTREEFLAAGADSGEDQPENYGCFVLEFERGQFWLYRPGSPGAAAVRPANANGTYRLEPNNRITLVLTDGEEFQFVWSVLEDSISFRKTGVGGPTGYIVKPFARVNP
jgi:hypothetical protein